MSSSFPRSPYLRGHPPYPFVELDARRSEREAAGVDVIDLGMGEPDLPTPGIIRRALLESIPNRSTYPRAAGLAPLREAAAGWLSRRFGVSLDPDREILPANGTKEAIWSLPFAVIDPPARPLALVPDPGYPVYVHGIRAAGGEVHRLPLRPENGFLPDLEAVPESIWKRAALLWINYPNNPTAGTATRVFLDEAASRCRRHGVLLASDEAYTEIYFGEPPPSALETGNENVVVFHSLSKRSSIPGYRTGFLAGDRRLIGALRLMRPGMGVATPQFIQEAARVAWGDDAHTEQVRAHYRRNRDLAIDRLLRFGFQVRDVDATFFIWLPVPGDETSSAFAARCLDEGVIVLPGPALGPGGEGFVRVSLTSGTDRLEKALARLGRLSL